MGERKIMTTPPPALCRMPSEEEIKKMALLFASLREGRWSVEEYEQEIHRLLESRRVEVDVQELATDCVGFAKDHSCQWNDRVSVAPDEQDELAKEDFTHAITAALGTSGSRGSPEGERSCVKEKAKNLDEPVDVIDLLDQIDCLKAELEAVKEKEPVDVEALAEKCMGVLIINSGRDYCDSIERECMRNEFSAAIRVALKEGAGEAMRPLGQKTNPEGSRSASEEGEGGAGVRKEK